MPTVILVNDDGTQTAWRGVEGVPILPHVGGARQSDALTGQDHMAIAGEWDSLTITVSATGDTIAYPAPCIVRAIRVRKTTDAGVATANTVGIILVKDGAVVKEGAAAAATPGTVIYDGLDGIIFNTNLTLNFASTSDTVKIEVLVRPLDPTVTWSAL